MKRFVLLLLSLLLIPSVAYGIPRGEAVERGQAWVDAGVMYSQSRYYEGYRQDCSGFVSMCWMLDSSYTSRTIDSVAERISIHDLRPGDAIWTPGHVTLFVGWTNDEHTRFIALEESTWGKPAIRREKSITSSSVALRYVGIEPDPIPDRILVKIL